MKKFTIATLRVAQIDANEIHPHLLPELKREASFIDTDKTLNEFLVCASALDEIAELATNRGEAHVANEAKAIAKRMAKSNFAYLQIIEVPKNLLVEAAKSPKIQVHVRGGVAYCDSPLVEIIDHDDMEMEASTDSTKGGSNA